MKVIKLLHSCSDDTNIMLPFSEPFCLGCKRPASVCDLSIENYEKWKEESDRWKKEYDRKTNKLDILAKQLREKTCKLKASNVTSMDQITPEPQIQRSLE